MRTLILVLLVIFIEAVGFASAHSCGADAMSEPLRWSHQSYAVTPEETGYLPRRLSVFQGLRVHPVFTDLHSSSHMSTEEVKYLQDVLIPAVVGWLEKAVKVNPVEGPLLLNRTCAAVYKSSGLCARPQNSTCGGFPVPVGT